MTDHPAAAASGPVVAPPPGSPGSSFRDMDVFGSYALPCSKEFATYLPRNGYSSQFPMAQFVAGDAPWNSVQATESRSHNLVAGRTANMPYYSGFRDIPAPSEGDDSGYYGSASGTKQSVMDFSLCDETRSIDAQSVHLPISDMHLQTGRSPDAIHAGANYRRGEWSQAHPTANSEVNEFYCGACKQSLKTKAELNKHKQRHDKPYRCEEPGCPRREGFGTSNDLDRHKKSVHKADGVKYRCTMGSCESKDKIWPRADNFRSHLKRVHKMFVNSDDPMEQFVFELPRAEDLACMGPFETPVDAPTGSASLSQSPWIMDQVHANTHGLPSGGIGFGRMGDAMQFHEPRGLVGGHDHSSLMGVDEIQAHEQEDPIHSDGIHMEMDPALAFGNLQRHEHETGSAPPELYAYKPDNLSQSSSAKQRCLDGSRAELTQAEDDEPAASDKEERRKDAQKDEPCTQEPAEQPGPEDIAQGSIVEDGAQDSDAEADSSDDDYKDDDRAAALDAADSQELFPGLQSSSSSCNDGPSSPSELTDESPSELRLAPDVLLGSGTPLDEDKASALIMKLIDQGKISLERLGYQKVKKAEVEEVKEMPANPLLPGGDRIPCSDPSCEKTFSRPCELKKHMKRHDKPYACTHTGCDKHFGSKNDWKRHENSQHTQLEFWKCGEKAKDHRPGLCGKICHRRETFKHHLGKDHQIKDTKPIEKQLQDCRVGRNYESRFWCGFCARTIDFKKNGGLACSERFDHIDEHFTGKGQQPKRYIREWKSIESEPAETFEQILPEETRGLKVNLVPVNMSVLSVSPRLPPLHDADSRKRTPDSSEDDNGASAARERKRQKNDDAKTSVLWVCCGCSYYWSPAVTMVCMETGCDHAFCGECQMVKHKVKD
ncbi:hypothetical protein B0T25DRAFT_534701 [Lasiosphaeria hispida]|uniref:C2H2-type domain-containing protein n=1 Tax=Lasiosphaeria hispida TaxID=260671 RepID=A0AAJ0HRH3_9PEZI|nr:hypothetical protein B0T25DRAFT_534701 [Lasiosphaeria hispida]